MKPNFIVPALTAVLGFSAAWLIKPEPEIPAPQITREARPEPTRPERIESVAPPLETAVPSDTPSPTPGREGGIPQTINVQDRDSAKMLRLTEVLNLSATQQETILKLIEQAKAAMSPADGSPLTEAQLFSAAATAGSNLEKAIAEILSPEQATAFENLRQRSKQNTIEVSAQTQLNDFTETLDLDPQQRSRALERIRDSIETRLAPRPSGISLVTDTSILPIGSGAFSSRALDMLEHQANSQQAETADSYLDFQNKQRQNLDDQLELYRDILSPAQQAQLKITIDERKGILDTIRGMKRR